MKIKKRYIFLSLIAIWLIFSVIVTPWKDLPGKTLFTTTRYDSEEGNYHTVVLKEKNQILKMMNGMDGIKSRWSPDKNKIVTWGGGQTSILQMVSF